MEDFEPEEPSADGSFAVDFFKTQDDRTGHSRKKDRTLTLPAGGGPVPPYPSTWATWNTLCRHMCMNLDFNFYIYMDTITVHYTYITHILRTHV